MLSDLDQHSLLKLIEGIIVYYCVARLQKKNLGNIMGNTDVG